MKRLTLLIAPALCWAGLTLSACGHENEIFVQEGTRVGNPAPKPPVEPVPVDTYEGDDATFVGNPGNAPGPVVGGLPDNDLPIGIPPTDAPPSSADGTHAEGQYPVVPTDDEAKNDDETVPVIEMPEEGGRPDGLTVDELESAVEDSEPSEEEATPLTLTEFVAEYPLWEGEIVEKDLACRFYTIEFYDFFSAVEIGFFEDEARENLCSSSVVPYKFIGESKIVANFEGSSLIADFIDGALDIDFLTVAGKNKNQDTGKNWNFQK